MAEIKKTNAARFLDTLKLPYALTSYSVDEEDLSATHAAEMLGVAPECVFKTLLARSDTNVIVVACIPADAHIDLKALARVAKMKRVELVAVKELLGLSGYIRGGCSPLAMKKRFATFVDESVLTLDLVYVSAGMRGLQLHLAPKDLIKACNASCTSLVKV